MGSATAPTVDLMDPGLLADPVCGFRRLRERSAVLRAALPGGEPVWLLTRYADIKAAMNDPRLVRDPDNVPGKGAVDFVAGILKAYGLSEDYRPYFGSLLTLDGAEHTRLRRLVSRAFTVRRIDGLRPHITETATALLDRLSADRPAELLGDYCFPLSGTVICELVGIDDADRSAWREWMFAIASGSPDRFGAAMRDMVAYTAGIVARRRAQPGEDLISGLISAQDEHGDALSDTELIALVLLLVQAGHHTTAHFIANATVDLLDNPGGLARLREDPALLPRATHELLRRDGPVPLGMAGYAAEDLVVGGQQIRQGDRVATVLLSANNDPEEFGEPEHLDLAREPAGRRESHLAFSHGPHYCLGAALARTEGEIALGRLLLDHPDLRLACAREDLEYIDQPAMRSLTSLPVLLGEKV